MEFTIYGDKLSISEPMREKIEKKLSFLNKYLLIDDNTTARVVCKNLPNTIKVEITIPTKIGILRSEVEDEDFYAAVDLSIDKLEDQIRRQKTRLSRRHKDSLAESFIEKDEKVLEEEDIAVKTKTITPEKMDLEEAIMRMEMLGHSFFIYVDNENDEIAVVYRRNDGKYGLIETER